MNIVSQMIVKKQQEFESKLQKAATNVLNSTFQRELSSISNSSNTEATSSSSTFNETSTLTDVDDEILNRMLVQFQQLQVPQLEEIVSEEISNTISSTISNQVQQSQTKQIEGNSANDQSSNAGSDKWNIMARYNISSISSSNETKYIDIISEMSEKYGVPVALIQKVIETESNFQNNASSSAGAQGLMQLMPATARSLGVTDSYNPRQNIEAGVKYLSQQLNNYNGDLVLALAAYNAGSGNVRKYNGVPPFRETINYINKITGIDMSTTNPL